MYMLTMTLHESIGAFYASYSVVDVSDSGQHQVVTAHRQLLVSENEDLDLEGISALLDAGRRLTGALARDWERATDR